mgnify:CR=1 FL=1
MNTKINEEYLSYIDYLKSIDFDRKLEILRDKYADKKVVLFGVGLLLDAILDNYNIKDYLNVIGISDSRIQDDSIKEYKGFNLYKPLALRALNFSVILDTNILFEKTSKFLRSNCYVKKSVKIEKLIQIPFTEHFKNFVYKQKSVFEYLLASKNIFTTIQYSFSCTAEELISKANYIKKLTKIKKSDKPIRTVFICSDIAHTEFMGLYNLLYFDKDFQVFPIIVIQDNLLESEDIDEARMQRFVDFFNSFDTKVIDGIDRETKELACIHAFKPDLVFYQHPIHIKDDFNPHKMSKQALTFTIEYDVRNENFETLGSDYYRKQVSNIWKVFINNPEDKNLFTEYTNTANKDLVKIVNKNINTGIIKFLKKELKR